MEEEEKKKYNADDCKITVRQNIRLTIKSPIDLYCQSSLSNLLGFGNEDVKFKADEEKQNPTYRN